MAHPMKGRATAGANAKMRRMTSGYGAADPSMNKLAPVDAMKGEGPNPEDDVGFGADSAAPRARGDRPARRTVAANPVATYARGGAACKAEGGEVTKRAAGGRTKKGSTNVNIIVAPGAGAPGAGPETPPPVVPPGGSMVPPAMAAAPPKPPMAMPPMGAPGGPPGGIPGIMPRARGGRTKHSDEAEDKALFKKMFKAEEEKEGEGAKRASGGKVHMTAGAESGPGRLEKAEIHARNKGKMHTQAV